MPVSRNNRKNKKKKPFISHHSDSEYCNDMPMKYNETTTVFRDKSIDYQDFLKSFSPSEQRTKWKKDKWDIFREIEDEMIANGEAEAFEDVYVAEYSNITPDFFVLSEKVANIVENTLARVDKESSDEIKSTIKILEPLNAKYSNAYICANLCHFYELNNDYESFHKLLADSYDIHSESLCYKNVFAHYYYQTNQENLIIEVFKTFEVSELYPQRRVYSKEELLSLYILACVYYVKISKKDIAAIYLNKLKMLNCDIQIINKLEFKIYAKWYRKLFSAIGTIILLILGVIFYAIYYSFKIVFFPFKMLYRLFKKTK